MSTAEERLIKQMMTKVQCLFCGRRYRAENVRVLRLPCTGRIDPLFILKAFEGGADGVIVSGCHPADCHYTAGNFHARRRFAVAHDHLKFLGVDENRITFSWVSASEGQKWADVVNGAVERTKKLGPFVAYRTLGRREHAGTA